MMENRQYIEALLAPVEADSPCGESIRYAPEFDRLAAARQQDDETLPTGVWQSTPRRADWEEVARIATQLTETRSKDLTILGWLGEAWIRVRGLSALPDALALLALALERYPEELHPQIKGDDYDYRAAPLRWVASRYATLVDEAPLFSLHDQSVSLREWQQGKQAAHPAPGGEPRQREALTTALDWLARLNALCQPWPTDSAPSFSALEQKIRAGLQALGSAQPAPEIAPLAAEATAPTAGLTPEFGTREQAYQTLKQVADYLARSEPHSPVPYLLYRAVVWGHTPLPELLAELICDDDAGRQLWKKLGVLP